MDRRGRRSLRFLEKFEHLRAIFLFYKHTNKSKFDMQNITIGRDIVESRPKKRRRLAADTVGSGAILSNLAQIPTLRIALRVRLRPVRVILSEGRSPNRT